MTWVFLFSAALMETVWAIAMKRSDGFTKLVPSLVFLVSMSLSMVLLAIAVRDLPIGTAYAIFTGIGAVGAALVGVVWLHEPATLMRILPIMLIVIGVVWLTTVGES